MALPPDRGEVLRAGSLGVAEQEIAAEADRRVGGHIDVELAAVRAASIAVEETSAAVAEERELPTWQLLAGLASTILAAGLAVRLAGRLYAAAAVLLAACDDGPDEAVDAFAEDPDCFGIELAGLDLDEVRCGTVTSPLHHDDPDGPTISLAVATLTEDDPDSEPILVLGGGPGEVVVETVLTEPMARQLFAFEGREVILLDQRGVGSSDPELACDAFDRLDLTAAPDRQEQRDALLACRQELIDRDVDLDAFGHGNNARDVDLVRRGLGHDRVVLRGSSYGSHLALHAAALAPDGFSALVLSSPADPTGTYLEAGPGGFQAALDRIDDACSKDERC